MEGKIGTEKMRAGYQGVFGSGCKMLLHINSFDWFLGPKEITID